MDKFTKGHLERVKDSVQHQFGLTNLGAWICRHTKIGGRPYSFRDHEYQEKIVSDTSQEGVVRKCSQVGLSEISARIAVATCAVVPNFTTLYTLPTAAFASTFMSTRVDPVIQSSNVLSQLIHNTMDNAEVKRFGNSFLYMKGSQSTNAPISIPVDFLIHDEIDYSSPEIISQYQSRLTHSKYKKKLKLSTPTVPKRGIDKEFAHSRRHFNFVKCCHCNHYFVPDYFEHVKVPDWDKSLMEITKRNLHLTRYREAKVLCPSCGKEPSLQVEHRHWVCENPSEAYIAAGYQVSPFDAPNIISTPYLIEASTQYKRYIDFVNANLGLPAEDKESALTREDLLAAIIDSVGSAWGGYVCGLDMGMTCWFTIGFCSLDGVLIVVKTEAVPLHRVRERYRALRSEYHLRLTVMDSLPYTDMVLSLQEEDPNLYGAIYVRSKNMETHQVRTRDESREDGEVEVRQVNINRDKGFDGVMHDIRGGLIKKVREPHDEEWIEHLTDMRRIKEFTADAEMSFVWRKSEEGTDHYHHSLVYLWVASRMLGMSRSLFVLPQGMHTFKVKERVE